jgi:uncharacterized metal-binding protein
MRAIMIAVVLSCMGCASMGRNVAHSAAPRIEASGPDTQASELASACDTVRARGRHTPVRLSDGTPVWCF